MTNENNGRSVQVRVNDRGPYAKGRVLDLSEAAADNLDMKKSGTAPVKVEVVEDFSVSKLSYRDFWKKMVKLNYAHLMDQFGNGPQDALYLPDDIRGMADDPYRTLAWIVRKEGAYEKTNAKFSEFIWADFFRKNKLLVKCGRKGLKDVVGKAVLLAKSNEARNLPGFILKKKIEAEVHATMARTAYITKAEKKGPLATAPDITKK